MAVYRCWFSYKTTQNSIMKQLTITESVNIRHLDGNRHIIMKPLKTIYTK